MQDTYSIGDISPKEVIPDELAANIPNSIMDQYDDINSSPLSISGQKSLEDREMDGFLELEYKRKVSDNAIKRRNFYVNWLIRILLLVCHVILK